MELGEITAGESRPGGPGPQRRLSGRAPPETRGDAETNQVKMEREVCQANGTACAKPLRWGAGGRKGPEKSRKPPEVTQQVGGRAGSRLQTPLSRGPWHPWVCVSTPEEVGPLD